MTTPQTDAPTLQKQLRDKTQLSPIDGEKINHVMRRLGVERMESADALDDHEATIAALVEALTKAAKRLDASSITNLEHHQAREIIRDAIALAKSAVLK